MRPAAGEALVRTALSAISAGTEMLVYRGEMPEGLAVDETIPSLEGSLAYPLKYGYAAVGQVIELGAGADPSWRGRRVFSFHPHQSHFTCDLAALTPLPEGLAPDDAVFLPNMETALGLVMDAAPLAGERVAVLGQGVVGLLTARLLADFPLERLVVVDRYPERLAAARDFTGAEALAAGALPDAHARSFDLVFELTGRPAALDDAIGLAGAEGRIVVGSWYGTKRAPVDLGGHFHRGRLRLVSSQVSRLAPELTGRWTKARRLAFAVELLQKLGPSRLITHRFPIARAAEAYDRIDRLPEEVVQVVLEYGG